MASSQTAGEDGDRVMGEPLATLEGFLLKHLPRKETFTLKDYERDADQTTSEAIEKRFQGYQKICMYGLGSAFWGAASGVLGEVHADWVHWVTIYFTLSLVLMLKGMSAATFSSSTPLARGTAGLGAWTAFVYILATFHIASLKFHSHQKHCVYSMIFSTTALTLQWGYSVQDPVVFHVISKSVLWSVLSIAWVIVICLRRMLNLIVWVKSALGGLGRKHDNSLQKHLLKRNRGDRTTGDYESPATV